MLSRILVLTAAAFSLFVGVALADAPNPIPGSTTLVSSSGTLATGLTITIEGQWNWTTHNDCPANRDGVGYQVAWNDGNTANPIGQNNSPSGIIYVGTSTSNMVFSLNNLDSSNTDLNFGGLPGAPFGAVPASYLSHNTTSSTPTNTDATNWNSNCGTTNPATELSTGTWGPISHTYPAGFKGPVEVCPIMYDPHGKSENAGGSGVGDLTAGGMGHNNDNSYEGNGNADACDITAFPTLSTAATATAHEGQAISDAATLSGSASAQGSISWSLLKYPAGTTSSAIATDQCKSGTPVTGSFTTNVNGDGTYTSPVYNVPTGGAGVYQWVATYNSSNSNNASIGATGCGVAAEESVVTPAPAPALSLTKQQEWLSVTAGASPTPPVGTYTTNPISGAPGWVVQYLMTVKNTGNETAGFNFADTSSATAGCDSGTLSGPTVVSGTYTPGAAGNGYGGLPTLTAGGQLTYTCQHTVKSTDNPWVNTATLSGIDINGTAAQVTGSPASVSESAINPSIGFAKTQTLAGSGNPYTHNSISGGKGQTVDYNLTVTNPSATDSLALTLSDPGCNPGSLTAPTGSGISGTTTFSGAGNTVASGNTLAPGGTAVYTCQHTIASTDTPFTNTATVTAVDTTTAQHLTASDSVSDTVATPSISLTKGEQVNSTAAGAYVHGPVTAYVGDTVNYLITITNTGPIEVAPTLTDAAGAGGSCDAGTLTATGGLVAGKLAPGASATWTCSHHITANDPTTLNNTASATAVDDFGNPTAPVSDTVTANILTLTLTLTKEQRVGNTGSFTTSPITVQPDDIINYEMIVTNTSDQALTPHFSDPNFTAATGGCDPGTLVPPASLDNGKIDAGASATWVCSHSVNETDPNPFVNTATVFGTDVNGHTTPTQMASVTANLFLNPAMTTVKEQFDATTNPSGPYTTQTITANIGDTIDYKVIVNNTGNEDLNVTATDPGCGTVLSGPTITPGEDSDDLTGNTLEQGASAQWTCSRVLTASDAPSFTNVATVTGTPPVGPPLPPQNPSVTVNVFTNPAFMITKTQSVNGSAFTTTSLSGQPGQVVSYHITVMNTGNVSLTFSNFTDANCDAGTITGGPGGSSIGVGGSATWSCTHTLTNADQSAGSYNNNATVTGTPPANEGSPVTNMSNTVTVTLTPLVTPHPGFTIVKTQAIGATTPTVSPISGAVGEIVNYSITVTNTGNVPLTFSGFSDPNCDSGTISGGSGNSTVAAGSSTVWTCVHTLTAADQSAGSYSNTATVTGTPPTNDGNPITTPSNTVTVTVPSPLVVNPGLSIVKTQRDNTTNPNGAFTTSTITGAVGDTIEYQIQISNTGNTAVKLSFSDPGCDTGTLTGPNGGQFDSSGDLSAGSSTVYNCTHVLTAADETAYTNTATVSGTTPGGTPVGPFNSSVVVSVPPPAASKPSLKVVKSQQLAGSGAAFTTSPVTAAVGDTVNYHFTITNTGNVALALHFSDPLCDAGTLKAPTSGLMSDGDLAPGGTVVYSCSHKVTAGEAPSLTNTVSVTGTPPGGTPTTPVTSSVVANVPRTSVQACTAATKGSAKLTHTKAAAGKPFTATVTGKKITRVSFFVDGHGYKTVLKPNAKNGGFSVTIDPGHQSFGAHTLRAVVTLSCGGPLSAKVAFTHPAPKRVITPQFTG